MKLRKGDESIDHSMILIRPADRILYAAFINY